MNDVKALLAQLNRSAAESLARLADQMGGSITYQPLDKGRSALNQMVECAGLNLLVARILETQTVPELDGSALERLYRENDTADKALALLSGGTDRLVKAIEAFPTEKLDDRVTLPFGGGMEKSFAEVALMCYWNMTYHEGQINYIQTLSV
jgi:hypothetical protein